MSTDGMWMTRGFHSKNATFSVRNYMSGALLYYMHLCQQGRVEVELYQGTSKAADGYGARLTMERVKEGCILRCIGRMQIPRPPMLFKSISVMLR